jgi:hypothetical protein
LSATQSSTTTLTGSFTDPGTQDTHSIIVNWNDGTPNTTIDLLAGVGSFSSGHTYSTGGTFTITVTLTDQDGGRAIRTTSVTTNPNTPSAPDLTAASDSGISNTDNITNVATPTFTGTADANVTVTILDGGSTLGTTTSDATGHWTFTAPHLADGTHSLTARATLNGVNSLTDSAPLVVKIDTTPPTVTVSSPASGATYDVGASFTFSYSRSDAVGVVSEHATLDGTTIANGATVDTTGMAAGTHTFTVVASDAAGNVTTRIVTFTVRFSTATLTSTVNGLTIPAGAKNALLAVLNAAQRAIDGHHPVTARALLTAFILVVDVEQARGLLSAANVATLTNLATALRASL